MPSPLEIAYRAKGLPVTKQRLLVINLLAEAKDHPTADQLFERAIERDKNIGRSAVSRALRVLAETGLAFVYESVRGRFRYEDATAGAHHHLVDADTGEMINFGGQELDQALSRVAADLGYQMTGYKLDLVARRDTARSRGTTTR